MTKGVILIVSTWILAILTLFALGIGFRTGLEIRLTAYNLDRLKALHIAKAGIRAGLTAKWKEYYEGKSLALDAFSEPWANDREKFKDVKTRFGSFTLSYMPQELDRSDKEIVLYGLEDETGKININSDKGTDVLRNLLLDSGMELEEAEGIVTAIEDWRDEDDIPKALGDTPGGAEDSYYQMLESPYFTSGRAFKAAEELLLVKGVTEEIYYDKLEKYITIFGDGRININTASKKVLNAAFGMGYPELAAKITEYRKGFDGKVGTNDDRWFTKGAFVIERGDRGMVEVKDLNEALWYGNIFGITDAEYQRMRELSGPQGLLSTSSDYYRATVTASSGKVKKTVSAVFRFNKPSLDSRGFGEEMPLPDIECLYWHEER